MRSERPLTAATSWPAQGYPTALLSSVHLISRSHPLSRWSTWKDRLPTFQSAEPFASPANIATSRSLLAELAHQLQLGRRLPEDHFRLGVGE
jgi:hypothetical protein